MKKLLALLIITGLFLTQTTKISAAEIVKSTSYSQDVSGEEGKLWYVSPAPPATRENDDVIWVWLSVPQEIINESGGRVKALRLTIHDHDEGGKFQIFGYKNGQSIDINDSGNPNPLIPGKACPTCDVKWPEEDIDTLGTDDQCGTGGNPPKTQRFHPDHASPSKDHVNCLNSHPVISGDEATSVPAKRILTKDGINYYRLNDPDRFVPSCNEQGCLIDQIAIKLKWDATEEKLPNMHYHIGSVDWVYEGPGGVPTNLRCTDLACVPTDAPQQTDYKMYFEWDGGTGSGLVFNITENSRSFDTKTGYFWNRWPTSGNDLSIVKSEFTGQAAAAGKPLILVPGTTYKAYVWDSNTNKSTNIATCALEWCGEEITPSISGNIYQVASINTPCNPTNAIPFESGELESFQVSSVPTPLDNLVNQNLITKFFYFNTQQANSSTNHQLSLQINDTNFQCANNNPADLSGKCITNVNPLGSNVIKNFCVYKSPTPPPASVSISGNIYQVASINTPCNPTNAIPFESGELESFQVSSVPTPLDNLVNQNLITKFFYFNTQQANSSTNHQLSLQINDTNFQCANNNPADLSGKCITNVNPLGSNVTQNFCVYKSSSPPTSKSISGNFYLTTDSNSCTDKSTLVNLKDTTSITSNPSLPITYEAAGTGYSLSTSAEGAHTVTLDLESSGYACACNEVDPGVCKISADPGDTDADFIVFDAAASAEPWWQVWGGLVYGHNNIRSDLPIYSTACEESSTCEPYLITAPTSNDKSAGIPITRLDNIMKNIRGYLTQHPGNGSTPYALNSDMKTGQTTENFLYFSEKVDINGIHEISSESISSLPPGTVRGTGLGQALVSKRVGNLTVRPIDTITVTGKHIIFVTGNLKFEQGGTLEHLIEVPEGNFLAFVVSGDVTIDGTVGNTNKSDTTSNIEAVIVADGIITVDSGNKRCVAEGSYVGWSGIVFKRVFDDNADHLITPTELFIHRPDFVTNTPDILKATTLNWQEVN